MSITEIPMGAASPEVRTLQQEVSADVATLGANAPFVVQEWTNPAAPAANALLAAAAVSTSVVVVPAATLEAAGKAALLAFPRNVTFTTAGNTPSDAPATATIVGTDIDDAALTEVVNVAQTATIAEGVKAFKTITTITYTVGQGTDATVAIGIGKKFGLSSSIKERAGLVNVLKEIANGAVVTNGTFANATTSPPHGSYSPSADPDASKDYAVTFEQVVV